MRYIWPKSSPRSRPTAQQTKRPRTTSASPVTSVSLVLLVGWFVTRSLPVIGMIFPKGNTVQIRRGNEFPASRGEVRLRRLQLILQSLKRDFTLISREFIPVARTWRSYLNGIVPKGEEVPTVYCNGRIRCMRDGGSPTIRRVRTAQETSAAFAAT